MTHFIYRNEGAAIIGAAMEVHKTLGCGFLEKVYQEALELELKSRCIPTEREKLINITYKGVILDQPYKADFVCYNDIILELKAVSKLEEVHRAQVLNYLKASGYQVGYLINFGETSLRFERFINQKSYLHK